MSTVTTHGGQSVLEGTKYQLLCAMQYLLSSDVSEIFLEFMDEDIVIKNIDETSPSIHFIQCKYIGGGVLHFSKFREDILIRFIEELEQYLEKNPETKFCFKVVTNSGLDEKLTELSKISNLLKEQTIPIGIYKKHERIFLKLKPYFEGRKIDQLSLLKVIEFIPNKTDEFFYLDIKKMLIGFGSKDSDKDLREILGYLLERKSGRITKNQLENDVDLGYSIYKVPSNTDLPYKTLLTSDNIKSIVSNVEESVTSVSSATRSLSLKGLIIFSELTADQLSEKASDYPLGSLNRKRIEMDSSDVQNTISELCNLDKQLKEILRKSKLMVEDVFELREKYKLI